jgi:UDP-GlcNAc:undecaprenyl-phosphate GlcNAc-1-phosphate transferase
VKLQPLFILALATAFVTALLATPQVRKLALKVGVLDAVDDRRMHAEPKPRIGGIAVYLGLVFALFVAIGFALHTTLFHSAVDTQDFFGLLFGGTLIMLVGVWDDIMGMRPRTKFLAQFVVAAISLLYGFEIKGLGDPLHHANYITFPLWLGAVLTLLWYVSMMNAINFVDGLDGLLSGLTAISGLSLLFIEMTHGHPELALVLAALVGGALGFLPFNFNPAKIILGDCGALFVGYVFATVSIIGVSKIAISISLLIPLVVLALPIVDTAVTIVRRMGAGKKITEADRGHFHHQLIFRFGLNVRQAVLLIYVICIALGAAAMLLSKGVGPIKLAGI